MIVTKFYGFMLIVCVQLEDNGSMMANFDDITLTSEDLQNITLDCEYVNDITLESADMLEQDQLDSSLELDLSSECCFETQGSHRCLSLSPPSTTVPSLTSTPRKNDSALPMYGM